MSCSITKSKAVRTALTCFTKALEHDSIRRHTEAMGCEFVFGRDPIAFTVHNLSAKVRIEKIGNGNREPVQDKRKNGRLDKDGLAQQNLHHHTQERTDLESRCIQSDC